MLTRIDSHRKSEAPLGKRRAYTSRLVSPAPSEHILILFQIVLATLLGGLVSIGLAAWLSFAALSRFVSSMVSLSAGLLLGASVLHLLPEAFGSSEDFHQLSWVLLLGLVGFFLLEKFEVLRHSHHHEGDGHDHHHGHDRNEAGPGGLLILVGDGIHNLADGFLVAAAFLVDPALGWLTAVAIAAHEIPQEVGDFIVLLNAGYSRARALTYNAISGASAVVGGVAGYFALEASTELLPFVLVLAASSFIYIALADLVPDMQRQRRRRESALQVGLLIVGISIVATVTSLMHGH